ncbi:uncharacterized protein LOC111635160 [Centruroides sculpturatus]|uniref:uncharacterized protein LOC111635160 n=1 Tax=Centruroides sculpturatus TaxID=218467 RepID=UPI000C6CA5DA|nr:uncharacterized protein LOC111635160 [Centruroides sculpturatus]
MKYTAVCFLFLCSSLIIFSTSSFIESRLLDVDPDANRNVTEIIISRGYPVEEYTVQTKDGYLLKLFRIPYGRISQEQNTKNRTVVFLQHGLLGSAIDWVINYPHQSLGYILADEGYDVWMGNQRGNTYARKHIKYSTEEDKFWNFSIDEHAMYDTPDSIDFVLNITGQSQLYYVGFSQGNLIVYAFLSENPEYNKIKVVLSLAPVALVGHIKSPIRLLAPFTSEVQFLYSVLGPREFLPNDFITELFAQTACNVDVVRSICSNIYFLISGYDLCQLNESRLDVYFSHFPAGTSTKNIIHYGQMVNSKELQKFDYGPLGNLEKYKQVQPPMYDIPKIKIPIGLFSGLNDFLADPEDVDIFRNRISNLIADYQVCLKEWGHLDFVFAKETKKYVYDELLRELKKIHKIDEAAFSPTHLFDKLRINMKYSAVCFLFSCSSLIICSTSSFIESRLIEVDQDANRNVTEIIISRGYPVEEYTVQTKDGYLLKLFRIPYGRKSQVQNTKNRPVVFLQHGVLESATDWVINFPNQSLGYILADEGYDVWMGNQRGNTYARKHIKYSTEEDKFWDFSIDEHAKYDTPDSIDFVLNKTGQSQLYYVGFSQGNLILYAFLSENPEYNKIKAVLSLAPTAWFGHIKTPIRLLAPFTSEAQFLFSVLGHKEFLPNDFITELFAQTACNVDVVRSICSNIYFLISGYDFSQLNESRLDVYFSHFPAGTSTKNIIHYGQLINSEKFRMFDYGLFGNLRKYKQFQPPNYDCNKIKTPIAIFWSLNDLVADPKDVDILRNCLPNLIADYQVPLKEWGHLDFVFAKETKKYVYDELLRILKSI